MNGGAQEEQYFYFEGEPTDAEVEWFARKMGMHISKDKDLLYLAREGLLNPPPDGWEIVKSQVGTIHWVNSDHTELMDDPPHLAELIENFKRVKKKAQMMANRGEDEKMNARKKLLGRNLPDSAITNDSNPPPNPRGGAYEEKGLKKTGPGTSDLMKEAKNPSNGNVRGGLNATPNQKPREDALYARESTDPRAKQARLEESEGEAFSIGEAFDDDVPYNYTKSTVKKRGETGSTPKSQAAVLDGKRGAGSGAILYRDEEDGSPLDEFITPSGKKEPPRGGRAPQNNQPNYSQLQQSQMVDSAVLEKMIQEINTMQMRVSEIEQQNANLKKQNQELVKGQRSLQVQTNKEIQAARREIEETMKEKEDQISKTIKEELDRKVDQDRSKFTLLKEIKDMKALLEQSMVVKPPNLSAAPAAATDLQKALLLADSVVLPVGQVPSQNVFHQSFGAEGTPELPSDPKAQYLGQGQQLPPPPVQKPTERVVQPAVLLAAAPLAPTPPVAPTAPAGQLGIPTSLSYEGKWLGVLLKEKALLVKMTHSMNQLTKRVKQRKKQLIKHEADMNTEAARLSLAADHPLILRIREFLRMQNKDLKKDKQALRREEDNYRRRAEGIGSLEQFLTFAQGTGSFTQEIDRQLEEVYGRFKDTPFGGLNVTMLDEDDESSYQSERRITQQGSSMTLDAAENNEPKPEPDANQDKLEPNVSEKSAPEGTNLPVVVTEPVNVPRVSETRKSSHNSKGSPNPKGTYFNEFGGRRNAKSIDKWPEMAKDPKMFSKTSDFFNQHWYESKMRDSIAHRPSSLAWEDFNQSSNSYMKRYFQTQSRWYSDIRREVVSCYQGQRAARQNSTISRFVLNVH